jgi:hypothetical protein
MRTHGAIASSIALSHVVHIATALALLVSMAMPNRAVAFASRPGRADCANHKFAAPTSHSTRLCATWATARPDRLKAVTAENEEEMGRTIAPACCLFVSFPPQRIQPARLSTHSASSRTNIPLRC